MRILFKGNFLSGNPAIRNNLVIVKSSEFSGTGKALQSLRCRQFSPPPPLSFYQHCHEKVGCFWASNGSLSSTVG